MKLKLWLKAMCVSLVVCTVLSCIEFNSRCQGVSQEVFRLHILANSNSEEDQRLKLLVRDEVLDFSQELFTKADSKQEAMQAVKNHLGEIEAVANEKIRSCGYDYTASAKVDAIYFNTRYYEDFTMPSGVYDALEIKIGKGRGKNWWCVMYPSLCVGSACDRDELQKALDSDEVEIVSSKDGKYKVKFKIVEVYQRLRTLLCGEGRDKDA